MAVGISVTIGNHFFRVKGDLTKFMRAMVDRYQIKDFLNEEDMQFCLSLFESHPDYPQKLAPGAPCARLLVGCVFEQFMY